MLYLAEEIVINALLFIFLDDLVLNHTWLKVEKSVNNIRQEIPWLVRTRGSLV